MCQEKRFDKLYQKDKGNFINNNKQKILYFQSPFLLLPNSQSNKSKQRVETITKAIATKRHRFPVQFVHRTQSPHLCRTTNCVSSLSF
ncbi:hypothetical protein QVD17_38897 [Tagetes erecta]|uniref:Uncharacterized protein n=1 Tax=Tagetes erecta TaxID=13708 RepID=A0AAD8NGL8_TARER|nr:hypothetical protein QVD17_38897 [Tagetes erecta]